jgi:sulfatase maturation enzyme AslB (radical SAM superfamily)
MTIQNSLPPRIHVLAKPSGATCNLACSYCFFLDKELLYPGSKFRMSDELVEYNLLTTVNRINGDYPLEVYRFLREEAITEWIQFIPVVERNNQGENNLFQEGGQVSPRSVIPEQFGRFLIRVFDEWVTHDVGKIFVQTFEAALRNWMHLPSSGMCVFDATCVLCMSRGMS